MKRRSRLQTLAAAVAALATAACASAPNPWLVHEQRAPAKALAADLDRTCPVVVHNATGQVLEALVDLDGEDRSLGLLAAGQSVTVGVTCSARRVHAKAVGQNLGPSEGTRFRASATLDVTRETRLRFTLADQVRW